MKFCAVTLALTLPFLASQRAEAQRPQRETGEAQWIWAPGVPAGQVPPQVCFLRKTFALRQPVQGQIEVSCQDRFELYVNGRRVGEGDRWQVLKSFDIGDRLVTGRNTIAVKAENLQLGAAGVVARVTVRGAGGTYVSQSTDASWKASLQEFRHWYWPGFNDHSWPPAQSFGELGMAGPWYDKVRPEDGSSASRFTLPEGFHVERVVAPQKAGSLTALAFDEWGDIVAVRESGIIVKFMDRDKDGVPETMTGVSEQLKFCQGILPLNGDLFATGKGPDGAGLYRLMDEDRDGVYETAKRLIAFKGGMNEHGPHAPVLGPDGFIYLVVGNHADMDATAAPSSPYRHYYEGDLVQPRYEDAGGHAHGVKAPGGMVIRTNLDGSMVETFAGGLRNAYDLAFNRDGELFTYDSDMEWDEGLPWYRPTRMLHVTPGAEFGWRSGWAKWPNYYLDSLPPVAETGRGSPTGVAFYHHRKFPKKYQGALFACDWSMGRILAMHLTPADGGYHARTETFLEGKPLNATDLTVGPDGWLYFTTGGRGTEGGVYRIVYTGHVPAPPEPVGVGKALLQPQFYSAFSRELVAAAQEELAEEWDEELPRIAGDSNAPESDRARALELMHLYGPFPTATLLSLVSRDSSSVVRAKAAYMMGLHVNEMTQQRLVEMLADKDATVRRVACEALARADRPFSAESVLPLLNDDSRYVRWAARVALQKLPSAQWRRQVLASDTPRVFNHGAAALLAMDIERREAVEVLSEAQRIFKGFVNDDDFIDLLRVMQLALLRGELNGDDAPQLRDMLAAEFPALTTVNPTGGWHINRELIRLLTYLQADAIAPRLLEQVNGEAPLVQRLHLGMYARFLKSGWTSEQKYALLDFFKQARDGEGGYSMSRYIDNVARDFVGGFTPEERDHVLANAVRWPSAALGVLILLPVSPSAETMAQLQRIDRELDGAEGDAVEQLQTGIVAVIGRSRDTEGMAYLREVFDNNPARRATLAMGLAQSPGGKNWHYLIRALPVLEGAAAVEVIERLKLVRDAPEDANAPRQIILTGLRLKDQGAEGAVALLEHWYDLNLAKPGDTWDTALKAWQDWYVHKFPDQPEPTLPSDSQQNKWSLAELAKYLDDGANDGDAARGQLVFRKAQCVKCHRFGNQGEALGPDLSTVSRRFQKREVLESVLYPSQTISSQYATKTIITSDGRQYTGVAVPSGADAMLVLLTNGQKIRLSKSDIEEIAPSKKSAMPEGLFNELSLQEIADLFAFLYNCARQRRQPPSRHSAAPVAEDAVTIL